MSTPRIERLSKLATISRHERILPIDAGIIRQKTREAASNDRRREILVLHANDSEPLQRMLNAMQPDSYVRPHRHWNPPKAEAVVVLAGAVGFVTFHDDGTLDEDNLALLDPTGVRAVDCREGVWHTFFALEPDTVVFEAKAGPFDPAVDTEFAPWAPEDGTPEGARYLESLQQAVRQRFGISGPR